MSDDLHELRIAPVETWAERSAALVADAVGQVLAGQERCLLALSGGSTPGPVFEILASCDLPWERLVLLQADERLSADPAARNLTQHEEAFAGLGVTWLSLPIDRLLADGDDPPPHRVAEVLGDFTARLVEFADEPPVIDIAQLGLGTDGHTASLFPGDPATEVLRQYVAMTEPHGGWARLTMTRPVFDRARIVIWLVRGAAKAAPLGRLLAGDLSIPAGMLRPRQSVIVADTDAARQS